MRPSRSACTWRPWVDIMVRQRRPRVVGRCTWREGIVALVQVRVSSLGKDRNKDIPVVLLTEMAEPPK